MRRTVTICDVTGKEGNTLPIAEKLGDERRSKLDAAGDTEEWIERHAIDLDLSHEGSMAVLRSIIAAANQAGKASSLTPEYVVRNAIERALKRNG